MIEQFQWLPFLLAITVLTMSPGVDTLLVLRSSAVAGWRVGFVCSLGICLGLFAHATISALGLSVILLGSATLFTAFKVAGALYLVYLGVQALRSAWRPQGLTLNVPEGRQMNAKLAFRQ
ncbi:MAG: LysE family translocator, partial [Pseudomonadota bacterium]|nr:LysE family translocator [Pseudomonadota bacterium]